MRRHITTRHFIHTVLLAALAGCSATRPSSFTETTLFTAGQGGYSNYRIPSLLVTAHGTILAFCEGRQTPAGPGNDTGEINILLRRSTDNGKTFQPQQVVQADGKNTCGNPCAVIDQHTGVIWLLTTRNPGQDHEKDITSGKSPLRNVMSRTCS